MFDAATSLKDEDPNEARAWLERSANLNYAPALMTVGVLVKRTDPLRAKECWERAASNSGDLMCRLGLMLEADESAIARDWWVRAAEAGHIESMLKLGLLLVAEEPTAAVAWWKRAASSGNDRSMFNLGLLYEEQRPAEARYWYRRAAEEGNHIAMLNLARLLLLRGHKVAAEKYVHRGASAGNVDAMITYRRLLITGSLSGIASLVRAPEDESDAMFTRGLILEDDDPCTSQELLKTAALSGHVGAATWLWLLHGSGFPKRP
jgi:TPR repeat protein